MAGHSKWATTKRHKAAIDSKRGKVFSLLSKEITIAAKTGGGDPSFNPRLRAAVNSAKEANMPSDNIERAIKKGTGELEGITIEELIYEGYAPGGVGIIVEVTTDNKNRSVSEVRSVFTKIGGSLAGAGALAYNFHRKGQILIGADTINENALLEIVLDGGAEDVFNHGDHFEVLCSIGDFYKVLKALEQKAIKTDSAELAYIPSNTVTISDPEIARKVLHLIEKLDDLDDVKNVYANFDIDDKVLKQAS